GSVYGFLGRNGAGKTTTVKMLSTVLHPTSGTATVGGFDVQSEALKVRSIIGVIGEGTELARPFWTPMEYLRFFSRLQGGSDGDAILRQGKLSCQGSKGDLPRTVFRIETGSPEQVQKYVTEHLPMASCSAIRNRLYVALREGMSPEGLKSSLQSAGLSIGGVA